MARELEVKRAVLEVSDLIGLGAGFALGWFGGPVGGLMGAVAGYTVAKRFKRGSSSSSHRKEGKYHKV